MNLFGTTVEIRIGLLLLYVYGVTSGECLQCQNRPPIMAGKKVFQRKKKKPLSSLSCKIRFSGMTYDGPIRECKSQPIEILRVSTHPFNLNLIK